MQLAIRLYDFLRQRSEYEVLTVKTAKFLMELKTKIRSESLMCEKAEGAIQLWKFLVGNNFRIEDEEKLRKIFEKPSEEKTEQKTSFAEYVFLAVALIIFIAYYGAGIYISIQRGDLQYFNIFHA